MRLNGGGDESLLSKLWEALALAPAAALAEWLYPAPPQPVPVRVPPPAAEGPSWQ